MGSGRKIDPGANKRERYSNAAVVPLSEACRRIGIARRTYYSRLIKPFKAHTLPGSPRLWVMVSDIRAYIHQAVPVPTTTWGDSIEVETDRMMDRVMGKMGRNLDKTPL